MTNIVVATLMWTLVMVLGVRVRRRPDNSILWAAVAIAVSFTTNIDGLYLAASRIIPWANGLDLAANCLLVVGIYYLSRSIGRGATALGASGRFQGRPIRTLALCAVSLILFFFSQIDAPTASTDFMLTYGDQVPAALYSMVQYTYIFTVMAGVLATCLHNVPRMQRQRFRVGFSFLAAGCISTLALCSVVVLMDVAHLSAETDLMRDLGLVYSSLYAISIVLLCLGLGIAPVGRLWLSLRFRRRLHEVGPAIRSLWSRTVAGNVSISLADPASGTELSEWDPRPNSIDSVHRMVIEIHDWMNLDTELLSDYERRMLATAEELCMQPGRPSHVQV